MEISQKLMWTFRDERDTPQDVYNYLVDGEVVHGSYYTVRDFACFTNKRLIVVDSQGLTGKKKEVYSIPYSSIYMFSVENAGTFDFESEVEMITKFGTIKITLGRKVDVKALNKLLSQGVLK
ncbi:MAG: PH domain-containing protein [Erysipelotrichaceae bacterium]